MEGQHFKGRAPFDYCDDPDRSIRLTLDEWRRVCPSVADDPPDGATFSFWGKLLAVQYSNVFLYARNRPSLDLTGQ